MSKNIISPEDAAGLVHKLITESIPVHAFLVSGDGARGSFRGFVRGFSDTLFIADKTTAEIGWYFRVPITPDCLFCFGDKRELSDPAKAEEFTRMGEAALMIAFSEDSKLTLFFNL